MASSRVENRPHRRLRGGTGEKGQGVTWVGWIPGSRRPRLGKEASRGGYRLPSAGAGGGSPGNAGSGAAAARRGPGTPRAPHRAAGEGRRAAGARRVTRPGRGDSRRQRTTSAAAAQAQPDRSSARRPGRIPAGLAQRTREPGAGRAAGGPRDAGTGRSPAGPTPSRRACRPLRAWPCVGRPAEDGNGTSGPARLGIGDGAELPGRALASAWRHGHSKSGEGTGTGQRMTPPGPGWVDGRRRPGPARTFHQKRPGRRWSHPPYAPGPGGGVGDRGVAQATARLPSQREAPSSNPSKGGRVDATSAAEDFTGCCIGKHLYLRLTWSKQSF